MVYCGFTSGGPLVSVEPFFGWKCIQGCRLPSCFHVPRWTAFVTVLVRDWSISYLQLSINQPLSLSFPPPSTLFSAAGFSPRWRGNVEKRDKKARVLLLSLTFNCSSFYPMVLLLGLPHPCRALWEKPSPAEACGKTVCSLIRIDKINRLVHKQGPQESGIKGQWELYILRKLDFFCPSDYRMKYELLMTFFQHRSWWTTSFKH